MIKTEELRLGNYVNLSDGSVDDDIRKVDGIMKDGINVLIKGCEHVIAYRPTKYIYSIPLTEEILLSCGFEKSNYSDSLFVLELNEWTYIHIHFYGSKSVVELSVSKHSFVAEVYVLNQLQNLYYALTQEELEIKL